MPIPITVVISCAGMGRRLGLAKTKALAKVCDKPLIWWQLRSLSWVDDIRVVVGYQAAEVIECVTEIRRDITFAINREYASTGTAASFIAGAVGARGLVVSLDGDLLVRPHDLRKFVEASGSALGVLPPVTDEPLYALLDEDAGNVVEFTKTLGPGRNFTEWSGLCKLADVQIAESVRLGLDRGHIYQMVEPHLPLSAVSIDAREIDTPDDFERAEKWLLSHIREWEDL